MVWSPIVLTDAQGYIFIQCTWKSVKLHFIWKEGHHQKSILCQFPFSIICHSHLPHVSHGAFFSHLSLFSRQHCGISMITGLNNQISAFYNINLCLLKMMKRYTLFLNFEAISIKIFSQGKTLQNSAKKKVLQHFKSISAYYLICKWVPYSSIVESVIICINYY